MIVTAAHEMLHAAWSAMSSAQKRLIVKQLNDFMTTTGDARIDALLTEYAAFQPGTRDNELHSLVGTQVRDLPAPLEGYYRRYFTDRSVIVDAFDAYQHVFDDLKTHYDQLDADVKALEGELTGLQAELRAAGDEADRLSNEIDALRSQGRIDESNQLVELQNAAVRRANGLAGTYNARVDGYNAKVAELNELAITLQNTYNEISPVPASD
jgi:chromosome segregation ATPase